MPLLCFCVMIFIRMYESVNGKNTQLAVCSLLLIDENLFLSQMQHNHTLTSERIGPPNNLIITGSYSCVLWWSAGAHVKSTSDWWPPCRLTFSLSQKVFMLQVFARPVGSFRLIWRCVLQTGFHLISWLYLYLKKSLYSIKLTHMWIWVFKTLCKRYDSHKMRQNDHLKLYRPICITVKVSRQG